MRNEKLKVRNEFTFWPVGQGLFYTGIIDDFTMVYDVGTLSKQTFLKKQIEIFEGELDYYHQNKVIDVLFLSHYDRDHINGIEYLINKGFTIKKIIAPFITPMTKFLYLIELLENDSKNISNYDLTDIIESYAENNVLFLKPIDLDIRADSNDYESDIMSLGETPPLNNVLDGIINVKYANIWKFKFAAQTNKNLEPLYHEILHWIKQITLLAQTKYGMSELQKDSNDIDILSEKLFEFISDLLNTNKIQIVDEIIKEINAIDSDIDSNLRNTISLILYHEPVGSGMQHLFNNSFFDLKKATNKTGQLLTGDSVFAKEIKKNGQTAYKPLDSWNVFEKKFISSNKDNIGLMLLPHHGSKFGWNNKLLNLANNFVVSYGLGNTHKHPHSQVTNKILLSKKHHKNLLEVNQNKNSILGITIY
ncbi:hypothetical protein IAP91_16845 [Leuconostoc mesenteroides]|nr:hypothetical protein [Leuconostoc mesenteroides]